MDKELRRILEDRFIEDLVWMRLDLPKDLLIEKMQNYTISYIIPKDKYEKSVKLLKNKNILYILKEDECIVYEYYKNMNEFILNGKGEQLVDICHMYDIEIFPFI